MRSDLEKNAQDCVNAWGPDSPKEIRWNSFNFVVQDHTNGRIMPLCTIMARDLLCLPRLNRSRNVDVGRKPIELTMENIRLAQVQKVKLPYPAKFNRSLNYHYSDSWRAIAITAGAENFSQCDYALFACAVLASYERLNARLEQSRHEVRQQIIRDCALDNPARRERHQRILAKYNDDGNKPYTKEQLEGTPCRASDDCIELSLKGYSMMGVDLAPGPYGSTICQTVIGIVPEHRRRSIPVLLRRPPESAFTRAMRDNYATMNARHAAECEIGRELLREYTAIVGAMLEEKIWRDVMNKLSLTSLWRE